MNAGERIKILRKHLKLTQKDFGDKLGTSKNNISMIESNKNNLTEAMAKAICREFNVDYFWLTEGTGEMFAKPPDTPNELIELVAEQFDLDEKSKQLLEIYLASDKDQRKSMTDFLINVANGMYDKEIEKTEG